MAVMLVVVMEADGLGMLRACMDERQSDSA